VAAELAESARAGPQRAFDRRPFVVGVVGAVAVGKSTTARLLADLLGDAGHGLSTEIVATDAFLLSNEQLEPLGGAMVKGYPQSYDWAALDRFLTGVRGGASVMAVPVYSHQLFDVVRGAQHIMSTPQVLIVEGLNLLQGPPAAPVEMSEHLDHSLYLDAPPAVIEEWFVARFLDSNRQESASESESPDSFYAMFAGMDDTEVEAVARWTWSEINAPNLRDHIEPTRRRADMVVHKAADHSITRIERRTSP
jgi:type I pantothenate kinase